MAKNRKLPDTSIPEASDFWDKHEFDESDDIEEVEEFL